MIKIVKRSPIHSRSPPSSHSELCNLSPDSGSHGINQIGSIRLITNNKQTVPLKSINFARSPNAQVSSESSHPDPENLKSNITTEASP